MGLFSKKKALEFPPRQAPMSQDIPDLNQLLSEAPVPPPELQQLNLPFPKGMENGQFPMPPGFQSPFPEPQGLHIPPPPGSSAKSLPAFEGVSSQSMSQQVSSQQQSSQPTTESFELPDFDEEDLKEIEDAERAPKRVVKEEEKPSYAAVEVKPESAEAEEPKLEYPEPAQEKAAAGKDKYLEINRCFEAKDTVEELRKIAKVTEDGIENHSAKETNERYHSLLNTLNLMQEKLILIDNKLFE
ncbi:MAG: hypothetical protein V1866_04580 [archaeon]